jgi:hypothetical protein
VPPLALLLDLLLDLRTVTANRSVVPLQVKRLAAGKRSVVPLL